MRPAGFRVLPPMLVFLALLSLALATPLANAQTPSDVSIVSVDVPEQTVGGKRFPVSVTLRNDGASEVEVSLFGVLYPEKAPDAESPCGPVRETNGQFTHALQPVFRLAPGQTFTYPPSDENPWVNHYEPSDVPPEPSVREFCVFAFEPEREDTLHYYDFHSLGLNVRPSNQPPVADFSWSPQMPAAARVATFEAQASDPDGDALTYRWDFGHHNASGRAIGTGASPQHRFYPSGTYTVTLVVSDGFDDTTVTRQVNVAPEPLDGSEGVVDVEPTDASGGSSIPVPFALTPMAVAAALGLAAAWRRAGLRRGGD